MKVTKYRQLSDEERDLTLKGIQKQSTHLKKLEEAQRYLEENKQYLEAKRKWEDYKIPIDRKNEDENIFNNSKSLTEEINFTKHSIKEMETQLKEGVKKK